MLIPEPVAAAVAYAGGAQLAPGRHVAVYDRGGGTFDTTVLLAEAGRSFEVVGRPNGDGQLGGDLFDELLVDHVRRRLELATGEALLLSEESAWREAAARLQTEVRRAKEAVSTYPYADVVVATPAGIDRGRVEREVLDELVRPYLAESIEILRRTLADAGVGPDSLATIHLAGGSTRAPDLPSGKESNVVVGFE
jgi:molecular chaperone DnaK